MAMLLLLLYSYYSMTSNIFFVNENIEILLFAQDDIDMTVARNRFSQNSRLTGKIDAILYKNIIIL
jgi:hypothetical protein